jgi:predicted dehydrogenase
LRQQSIVITGERMSGPRVLVVGVSHWHAPLYLDALARRSGRLDVVAVSDDDLAVAQSVARRVGAAQAVTDLRAVDTTVDLAIILGRHDRMAASASMLIDRGIPFVLEKPGGLNLGELMAVRDRAARARVPAAVPLVHRRAPFIEVLRSVDRPRYLSASYLVGAPDRYRDAGCDWMLDPAAGGGVLANLGPHFTDLVTWLTGEPIASVRAAGQRQLHGLAIEDHAVLLLETASGFAATIELGYVVPGRGRHFSMTAVGDDGFMSIFPDGRVERMRTDGTVEPPFVIDVSSDPLFDDFVGQLLATLPQGFAGLPGLDDLVAAMTVVDSAYRDIEQAAPRPVGGGRAAAATWAT